MADRTDGATLLPVASAAQVRAVVTRAVRLRRGRALAVAALYLAASAAGVTVPACLGRIVDAVTAGAGLPTLLGWAGGAALGAAGAAAATWCGARVLTGVVQDVLAELREDVFASAMRLPVAVLDDGESADLLSRVTGDVDAVAEAGGDVAPGLLSATFAVAVSLVALTALDPWLALAGLACVPFYVLGTRAFLRRSKIVFREVRVREASRSQAVLEAVEGTETVTALGEQDHALERVGHRAEASIQGQVEGVRLRNRLFRWINGGEAVGLVALLATGFALHAAGTVTVGTVTTAALVFHRLFDPVGQLIFGLDDIQRATVGLARLVGVIGSAPAADDASPGEAVGGLGQGQGQGAGRAAAPGSPGTGVDLREVTFRYLTTGRGVVDVSLRVEPGTTVAVVGSSGSGKSTLARVVAGHHAPVSGSVVLDPPATPYYISQETHAFRGSVADTLRLVAPDAEDDDVVAALLAAGAGWAVAPSAGGTSGARGTGVVDAPGDPGVPLDEGRTQQLAVARAILADPAVVILDEATAEVGLVHRHVVESAVTALRRGRTVILVAHRLEQVVDADQVVVLADGSVVQQGTHDELVAADGPYRTFWEAQSGAPVAARTTSVR